MTLMADVPNGVFKTIRDAGFTERGIIERTTTIAAYNCVCRAVIALGIE